MNAARSIGRAPYPTTQVVHRYAVATAMATFCLLIAGSLVTSTDSGLAVPDWPLSYGTLFPPMVGGIRFEHGHRLIAGVVALMILGLAIWLWRAESHRWVRWLGYSALIGVLLQAILGGLTVLLLLPPPVSIAHACLGQVVFCLTVSLAYGTSAHWASTGKPVSPPRSALRSTLALSIALFAAGQLILGAIIRHTGYAVAAHILNAILLVFISGSVFWIVVRNSLETAPLQGHVWRLCTLLALQMVLGISVLTHHGAVMLRSGHVVLGALILAQAVILAWEAIRQTVLLPATSSHAISVGVPG